MKRRELLFKLPAAFVTGIAAAKTVPAHPPGPDAVLAALREGNHRFAANHARHPHAGMVRVRQTWKEGQHPQAVVLCCSDSRVVPEIVFDQGLGDLFAVRVAGNVANEDEVASVEYAVEHLGVGVCVVLGHYECGAVTAVVRGEALPPEIEHLVAHIRTARQSVEQHQSPAGEKALIQSIVRANVWQSIHDLLENGAILRDHVRRNHLRIVGAVYRIADGKVEWMGLHPQQSQLLR